MSIMKRKKTFYTLFFLFGFSNLDLVSVFASDVKKVISFKFIRSFVYYFRIKQIFLCFPDRGQVMFL
ncbi:hypothetical protein M2408_005253 [Sphingobacterium sp. BIGb0165]|nr:hypothetical protein [Sphingobacterium sp. BIGb0165]